MEDVNCAKGITQKMEDGTGDVFAGRSLPPLGTSTCHPGDPKPLFICHGTKTYPKISLPPLFFYSFIYLFGRCLRYLVPSPFLYHSIAPNSRLSLMPIFTGVSINYGLYFQANQEKYQGNCLWYQLLFFIGVFKISSKILTIDSQTLMKFAKKICING